MNGLLRVLIVEDSEDDTLLVVREFKQAGYGISFERVETEAAMEAALSKEKWDIVISDYVLPDFSGLRALRLLQRKGIDLPFIIVSGKIGEGVAVEAVKAGAHDYLMKNNLKRLVVAVEHEIGEAENRRERKQAEEALRESQERYRALVENTVLGITVIDTNYKIVMANAMIAKLFNKPTSDFVGKNCFREYEKREAVCPHCPGVRAMASRNTTEVETQGVRDDGSRFYVRNRAIPFFGQDGVVKGFIEMVEDIDARKKAEAELYRVNRALKTLSECNQRLIRATEKSIFLSEICQIIVGVGGYRLAWVGLAEQDEGKTVRPAAQAGYEEGYLENLNITWSDTEAGRGPTGTAIRTGKVYICRNILTDPNFEPWCAEAKKRGYASSIAIPLIAENPPLGALNIYASEPDAFDKEEINLLSELADDLAFGIVALHTRVEREQAQESLKKLSSAVEQTADIVIITDKDGVIEYINPAFEKVTGYTKEETVGKTPRIIKSGRHDQRFYELLWQTIISGKVFRDTLINKKKNGELYYAEKTITPIRDAEANITHFVSTDKDITEHKEIEKRQRLAQLGELVADMAHEVNNPLMIISGNAQLCLMEEILNDGVKNNLKIITEECQKAKSIIQRLLKFSRPSKGEFKETDINKSIETVVGILEHQFKLVGIEIKRNYVKEPHFMLADEQQIQEVFMNLLNNARDAMPKGGIIEISTNLEREFMKIDFKDTGCGMSEEVKKRLFEPFFTTKEKGTGLGLSVCYGIIKAHNGEIKFESTPGKVTTATILLPLKSVDNV
jgi:PAS domain S-box-containing protein